MSSAGSGLIHVGGSYRQVGDLGSDENVLVDRGVCFSACAYAFLGGRIRELNEEGILGVHQFRTRDGDSGEGAAQVTEAILADYIDEMGANRRLLDIASATEPSRIKMIPLGLARALNLDNSDPPKAQWELKADHDGELTLVAVQPQARNDAITSLSLLREGEEVIAIIAYSIRQDFRSKQEVDEAFHGNHQLEFDVEGRVIPDGVATWAGLNKETYATRFEIPRAILNEISHAGRFRVRWEWPNVLSDLNPTTEFGTVGFRDGLSALLKNGGSTGKRDSTKSR
jgi:hypothetical protein